PTSQHLLQRRRPGVLQHSAQTSPAALTGSLPSDTLSGHATQLLPDLSVAPASGRRRPEHDSDERSSGDAESTTDEPPGPNVVPEDAGPLHDLTSPDVVTGLLDEVPAREPPASGEVAQLNAKRDESGPRRVKEVESAGPGLLEGPEDAAPAPLLL